MTGVSTHRIPEYPTTSMHATKSALTLIDCFCLHRPSSPDNETVLAKLRFRMNVGDATHIFHLPSPLAELPLQRQEA